MDPICHTLVGAALAESGLKRRTALGAATLIIGANLSDIDVLAYAVGPVFALWFRRGATHGVLALLILPFLLAGAMVLWDRGVRRRRSPASLPAVGGQLLLLSAIAILTHPTLDFLNTYGIRWLMPFSDRWYYGDTLFIVDPWIWAVLAGGIYVSRKMGSGERGAGRGARISMIVVAGYITAMGASGLAARAVVRRTLAERGLEMPTRLMVAPVAVNPFRKWVVLEVGEIYRFGTFDWLRSPRFILETFTYERHPASFAAAAATRGPRVRQFLSWARFPFSLVDADESFYRVELGDARYTLDPANSWAGIVVEVGRGE